MFNSIKDPLKTHVHKVKMKAAWFVCVHMFCKPCLVAWVKVQRFGFNHDYNFAK